jgi:hypothetical protein
MKLLKKEMLRTTTKPGLVVVFALIAAVAISVGYVLFLAVLAPQQLAEATAAASDVVCNGCVGTTDIASNGVTAADIGSGQVGNSELATGAVTSIKIGSGQVANSDLASSAVTSSKISDTSGVQSADIVNGQVKTEDLASGAIKLNVHKVKGDGESLPPEAASSDTAECPSGETLIGGGFDAGTFVNVFISSSSDAIGNTWAVSGVNQGDFDTYLVAHAICVGPSP